MLWKNGRRSSNVEDRRRIRIPGGKKGGGIGVLLLALVGMYFGIDPALILNMAGGAPQGPSASVNSAPPTAEEQELAEFISVVLADTEDTWNKIFTEKGGKYREPKLVLFTGQVQSACGYAQAAMGPFYCPGDQQVYIDLAFYKDLRNQLDAPGDFAQAYVVAHEIGHHVQKLIGISDQVHQARQQLSKKDFNKVSVKLELQADCFAGIWANHADRVRNVVEPGDIDEALNAASHIGDDRLQKQSRGYVTPDSFTHGSSAQRVQWFKTGYQKGTLESCDTFSARRL
ncbi:MAG TPA: flagellar biosynthesis protein FlgM [Desulfobacterales bacterium]|nr:flagellar biosynthesis protein FlgM [Desulfobacterales bacterium]HIP38891.1 flagellar biosynthesis protein FlgM [Desulfocapsa sulfexigens]